MGKRIEINKNELNCLRKDRDVNATFTKKLTDVGFVINYGKYGYWDGQPYVQIGDEKVWLIREKYNGNDVYLANKKQNSVIEEIENTIIRANWISSKQNCI